MYLRVTKPLQTNFIVFFNISISGKNTENVGVIIECYNSRLNIIRLFSFNITYEKYWSIMHPSAISNHMRMLFGLIEKLAEWHYSASGLQGIPLIYFFCQKTKNFYLRLFIQSSENYIINSIKSFYKIPWIKNSVYHLKN